MAAYLGPQGQVLQSYFFNSFFHNPTHRRVVDFEGLSDLLHAQYWQYWGQVLRSYFVNSFFPIRLIVARIAAAARFN